MKKIFLYLCFLTFFSCSGYEPIFSTKDFTYHISDIKNMDDKKTTRQVVTNILSYKLDTGNNKNYSLKVNSNENKEITSRDSKGNALTYRITINVEVAVLKGDSNILLDTINIMKDFTYNYQINQFELGQYKKDIIESLIVKISEEIIVALQLI
jgi:outer membrane lipopolysaccharide assembly protein LptE/RlpB